MKPTFLAVLLAASLLAPAHAQGPSANWRTLTTSHFRVHYPASSEAWARRAAARLDSIREQVVAEVGFAPLGRSWSPSTRRLTSSTCCGRPATRAGGCWRR